MTLLIPKVHFQSVSTLQTLSGSPFITFSAKEEINILKLPFSASPVRLFFVCFFSPHIHSFQKLIYFASRSEMYTLTALVYQNISLLLRVLRGSNRCKISCQHIMYSHLPNCLYFIQHFQLLPTEILKGTLETGDSCSRVIHRNTPKQI